MDLDARRAAGKFAARAGMAGAGFKAGIARAAGAVKGAWGGVGDEERARLRNHALAIGAAASITLPTFQSGLSAAGPLIFADVAIALAGWFGGFSCGAAAALTVVFVMRLAAVPLTGEAFGLGLAALVAIKGLVVAGAAAALAAKAAADATELIDREARIDRLSAEVARVREELAATKDASAAAHAQVSHEADLARMQLTTLQSVTDPDLNAFRTSESVTMLLDRLRAALDADGVAVCSVEGRTGRIFSSSDGVAPLGAVRRSQPEVRDFQTRRTTLVHNDAGRVADTSLCGWPADITSLIAVPVVHAGRLQLIVEVVNRHGRRSTEWELALIQVVAERAGGLLRQESYGAVA
jgi:GAF domain-containing protein